MSANYDIPLNHIPVDKNKKKSLSDDNTSMSLSQGMSAEKMQVHNPMYGVKESSSMAPLQDDGMYCKLNSPIVNNSNASSQEYSKLNAIKNIASPEEARGIRFMGKNMMIILLSAIIAVVAIIALVCLSVAFVRISELNDEVASLRQSLSANVVEATAQSSSCNITCSDLSSFRQVFNPAASCAAVLSLDPSSPSGYYWIRSYDGSVLHVFCDMTRSCGGVTGGWMRVAELDMTNSSSQCPISLVERNDSNIHTCRIASRGASCSSVTLFTGITYSKVCGKIQGYQYGSTDGFAYRNPDINTPYVDGVTLTHGKPRQHIWTFAAALHEFGNYNPSNCPCIQANGGTPPPAFVGNDYFCDTGSEQSFTSRFYNEDPLWDGAGCGPDNTCCSFNDPPWFYKQLPTPTTDDMEMRVCRDQDRGDEDVAIEVYDIYVQ